MSVEPIDPKSQASSAYALAFGLGSELLGALAVGAVPGWWIDKKFHTSPWGILVGVMVGICLGLFQLIRSTSQRQNGGAKRP